MQEISLNILDIAQNSIKAKASLITIDVFEDVLNNLLTVKIVDNGCGMSKEQVEHVIDPFFTTRTTRKVGLGIPFFKMAAEMTGGNFEINSTLSVGTEICAKFIYDNIDRMPLGDMTGTICSLIQCNPNIDFLYVHKYNEKSFVMDTREIRETLEGVPLDNLDVIMFLKSYIDENYSDIKFANDN